MRIYGEDMHKYVAQKLLKKCWLPLIISLIMVACNYQQQISPTGANSERRFFKETGYTVQGEFLHFFNIYGGADSLGYPLTKEILVDGWRVQYFQKGRLEYHPENEPTYRVTVGWLGDLLNRRRPPVPTTNIPRADMAGSRYYKKTGHTLNGDFLRYFDTHGGSVRFGLPISEPFLQKGQLTQDFQSARFFWTPQDEEPVTLEEIGRVHLEKIRN